MSAAAQRHFARWLESQGPGGEERARRLQLTSETTARDWARAIRLGTESAIVLGLLGEPARRDDASLIYDLPLRPNHRFRISMKDGAVLGAWFENRDRNATLRAMEPVMHRRFEVLARHLIACEADAFVARTVLGPPVDEFGWWPIESWTYAEGKTIELRLGLVEAA